MFYNILLITNTFLSFLLSSSEQHCNSTKNTTDCQIMYVKPLNVILNSSNSEYDHKMSAYTMLKSDKIYCYKQIEQGIHELLTTIQSVWF